MARFLGRVGECGCDRCKFGDGDFLVVLVDETSGGEGFPSVCDSSSSCSALSL